MKKVARVYTFFVLAGGFLTAVEFIMSLWHSSLCTSAGCRIVASYLRFDERYMYLLGFFFFCALFITERKERLQRFGPLLLMCALAAEGYLVGFQLFIAHTVCQFCIAVASIITIAALLKLISGVREPIVAGFCLFALTGFLVGSINATSTPIPTDQQYVLIYSKDCPHCEDVIRFAKERAIPLELLEASQVKNGLIWMSIDAVPVLICNDDDGKKIYSGANIIKEVLSAKYMPSVKKIKAQSQPSEKKTKAQPLPSVKASSAAKEDVKQNGSGIEIFNKGYGSLDYFDLDGRRAKERDETCSINTSSTTCEDGKQSQQH